MGFYKDNEIHFKTFIDICMTAYMYLRNTSTHLTPRSGMTCILIYFFMEKIKTPYRKYNGKQAEICS